MSRLRAALFTLPLCASLALSASAQQAAPPAAPPGPNGLLFDPQQLPAFHGKVAEYSLTPRGGVDGLILDDGAQVAVSRRLSTQLVAIVKPGDAVTVHGVKATSGTLILALSVANDAGGKILVSEGGGRRMRGTPIVAQGKIKALLHNRRDEVDGVLLEDGSQIRVPPPMAMRIMAQLTPGQTIFASGFGQDTLLGKVVMPRRIGATEADAVEVRRPPMMGLHGMPGGDGPGRDGPPDGMRPGFHRPGGPDRGPPDAPPQQ